MDHTDRLLVLLMLGGLAAAVALGIGRVRIEQSNRTVELIVDGDDARRVAVAAGLPSPAVLLELKAAGATALAVRQMTLGELVQAGRVIATDTPQATVLVTADSHLWTPDRDFSSTSELVSALEGQLPSPPPSLSSYLPLVWLEGMSLDQIEDTPVMFRPEDIAAARATGLRIVARLANFPAVSPRAIEASAAGAARAGARLVVFREDEVLGYPQLLGATASAFNRHNLLYGFVEIASQKGDQALAWSMASRLVRVHSMTNPDLENTSPQEAVARYLRAVRERNVRACYLRLMARGQADPLGASTAYVRQLVGALRGAGYRIGPPGPFNAPEDWPPWHLRVIVLAALPAAFVLLMRRLIPMRQRWALLLLIIVTALGFLLAHLRSGLVVPGCALAAACIFPALGTIVALQWARRRAATTRPGELLGSAFLGLCLACGISLVGAAVIVGLFSRVGYLVGAGQFVGVKLSYLVPLPLVLLAVIGDLPGRVEPISVWWTRLRLRFGGFCSRPVVVIEALVIVLALAAIAVALMRSGNQSLVAPLPVELRIRNSLESLLVARPRTKEFLVGYPALMLAMALALRGRRHWLPFVALLATVGQISLINTYCHFHVPLLVSLLRTLHGFWIGTLIGLLVVVIWKLLCLRRPAPQT